MTAHSHNRWYKKGDSKLTKGCAMEDL
jgi:hypothetical protein